MTFTEFLRSPRRLKSQPPFIHLAFHDALWPKQSNRLEDFESFLLVRLEEESEEVIPQLRDVWREYAREFPGEKHDLDLAIAAWGDYARHLQGCSGSRFSPCEVAEQLLERALDESSFEDLRHPMRVMAPCEGVDELDEEDGDLDDDDLDDEDWDGRWEDEDSRRGDGS